MPKYFIDRSGNYFETNKNRLARDGETAVPQRPAPHWEWTDGQWIEGDLPTPPRRPLSRWSFIAALDEADATYLDTIRAAIAGMPEGRDKTRAKYKLEHETTFRADAQEIQAVRRLLDMNDATFDTLWAAGEALEYGG